MASQGKVFGEAFSLDLVGLSDLPGDTAIPGVAVFSRRAMPLAAWTRCATEQLALRDEGRASQMGCQEQSECCWTS